MTKNVVALALCAAVVFGVAGCGSSQEDKFRQQLTSAGMSVKDISRETDKKKRTSSSSKPRKSKTTTKYEAEVQFGRCVVEFEQGKGETRYYLDEVNGSEPTIGLVKDNPTKADVDAYLAGPASPCTP